MEQPLSGAQPWYSLAYTMYTALKHKMHWESPYIPERVLWDSLYPIGEMGRICNVECVIFSGCWFDKFTKLTQYVPTFLYLSYLKEYDKTVPFTG